MKTNSPGGSSNAEQRLVHRTISLGYLGSTRALLLTLPPCKSPQPQLCKMKGLDCFLPRYIPTKAKTETFWFWFCIKRPKIIHSLQFKATVCFLAIKLIQLDPGASRLGLRRQPAAENMSLAEPASEWQKNAVLSRSSQMVGNTTQCCLLLRLHQHCVEIASARAPGTSTSSPGGLSLCVYECADGQLPRVLRA